MKPSGRGNRNGGLPDMTEEPIAVAGSHDGEISCANCKACCCKLEVMLMGEDDIPEQHTIQDAWGGWIMRRLADGWCSALDRATMRCTIYELRPQICRDFAMGEHDCLVQRRSQRDA
jgi:Fe-S-cluster containining protein